ncbi:MAG: hypothetical protein K2Y21_04625 [Phycisphaerales bacterium]|nr:hypothetical protein [Phycisphaerales bacterium]
MSPPINPIPSQKLPRALPFTALASIICGVLGVLALSLDFTTLGTIAIALAALGLVFVFVGAITVSLSHAKTQRGLKDLCFGACPNCSYRLDGLSNSGSCPECGTAYTRVSLRDRHGRKMEREGSEP